MSRRAPADGRARAGGGDAPGRRERTAPVELRSLDLLNGVRRQPLGYNRPTVQALPYSTIPRVCEVEIVTVVLGAIVAKRAYVKWPSGDYIALLHPTASCTQSGDYLTTRVHEMKLSKGRSSSLGSWPGVY